jgi:hypothetical protein
VSFFNSAAESNFISARLGSLESYLNAIFAVHFFPSIVLYFVSALTKSVLLKGVLSNFEGVLFIGVSLNEVLLGIAIFVVFL